MKGANSSGKNAELIISFTLDMLKSKGYNPIREYTFKHAELEQQPIFSKTLRVDFLVRGIPNYESGLVFSSKRQTKTGSIVKGLYYEVDYVIKKCLPCPAILVMTGNQFSDKIKIWLEREIDKKLIAVFYTTDDLLQWVESVPKIDYGNNGIYKGLPIMKPLFDLSQIK